SRPRGGTAAAGGPPPNPRGDRGCRTGPLDGVGVRVIPPACHVAREACGGGELRPGGGVRCRAERGGRVNAARVVLATLTTIVAAWALASSAGVSVPWRPAGAAELRLSWSARPERIEVCRTLSAEELAARPVHMRREVECEGRSATYALQVAVDGSELERMLVQ